MTGQNIAQQRDPSDMADVLRPYFVDRNESAYSWKSVVSSFMTIPGLTGLWAMSNYDESGNVHDLTGQGRTLWRAGGGLFQSGSTSLVPYINLDGSGDYLWRADEPGLDIDGTESHVAAARRGLTFIAWAWFDGTGASEGIAQKGNNVAADSAWDLRKTAADQPVFRVSTGAAWVDAVGDAIDTSRWYFFACRYDPSTEIKLWVDDVTDTDLVGVPASLPASTENFELGRLGTTFEMDGRISIAALSSQYVPDFHINALFQWSRKMHGV